jgi:hypothetical protein
MEKRKVSIVFVKDYKSFILTFNRKDRSDYILNVSKLIKDKFSTKFIVPNKVQSFLLNYEIKKLLDKAINVKNEKYSRIIYLNSNLSESVVLNMIDFITNEYPEFEFSYGIISTLNDADPLELPLDLVSTITI